MEEDRRLFEEFILDPGALPILRIYRVSEPAVSVGRSWRTSLRGSGATEAISSLRLLRRAFGPPRNDAAVCIRPTGGGLVRHGNDLLYSVLARRDTFPTFHQVRMSYLSFHEVVQEAFRDLGIETSLFRCDDPRAKKHTKEWRLENCFERPVPTDLGFNNRKIAGAAQWRRRDGFLHQGSIQLVQGISFESLKLAFLETFERRFGEIVRAPAQLSFPH